MSYRFHCAEVWGGIDNVDQDLESAALKASLYSRSAEGGRGGDIYYFSVCGGDMLTRIAIADVMGHGQAVSEISSWVYDSLKQHLGNRHGEEVIGRLNNQVESKGFGAMTTIALASLIVKDGSLYFSYAGHPPIMVYRKRDNTWRPAHIDEDQTKTYNMPLGVMQDATYIQNEMALDEGDKIFVYTDGVIEAPSPGDEPFGEDGLLKVLNQHHGDTPTYLKGAVLDALMTHTGGRTDHDDVTLLAVEAN